MPKKKGTADGEHHWWHFITAVPLHLTGQFSKTGLFEQPKKNHIQERIKNLAQEVRDQRAWHLQSFPSIIEDLAKDRGTNDSFQKFD